MRFEQLLHWNDGQFLQPHHFQYFQRQIMDYISGGRSFSLPYPWGLADLEIDDDALAGARVTVKRFAAVMKDGTALSMPGNCLLPPLDLTGILEKNPSEIIIYAALPLWSELQANLAENAASAPNSQSAQSAQNAEGSSAAAVEKRRFVPHKRRVRDENSGDNEITLITRLMNVRLTTDFDDNKDMTLLPLLKLLVLTHDKTRRALAADENFFPPYITLGYGSPLWHIIEGLAADIRRCRDKAQDDLISLNFKNEQMSGYNAYTVLRLKTLNLYEQRLSSLLAAANIPPFDMYMELSSLLSELMAYDPINSVREIRRYNHDDCAPQFLEIIRDIRSFILKEGGADYVQLDFKGIEEGRYLYTPVKPEDIFRAKGAYLALKCGGVKDAVVKSVEEGDTFKLINPQAKQFRIRGVKLTETHYPPRYLPVLEKTIWFSLDLEESARVWREITEERGMAVDFVPAIFPSLELSLYLTTGSK
jgi:type VI secretion system protein ImpJ